MSKLPSSYLDLFSNNRWRSTRSRSALPRYLDWTFQNIDFKDKSVLDIGGGTGLISFYAAIHGARSVKCVEPLSDGSGPDMLQAFDAARQQIPNGERVELKNMTLAEYHHQADGGCADIVIMHNAINHLNESACTRLGNGELDAELEFLAELSVLTELTKPGGILINADASRECFWNHIPFTNPFAPTIERDIHQQPETWTNLLEQCQFKESTTRWTPVFYIMTGIGNSTKVISERSLSAYYSLGHFVSNYQRC